MCVVRGCDSRALGGGEANCKCVVCAIQRAYKLMVSHSHSWLLGDKVDVLFICRFPPPCMRDVIVVVAVSELFVLGRVVGACEIRGVASASCISWSPWLLFAAMAGKLLVETRDCLLWRFGVIATVLVEVAGCMGCLGGAAAIGTTPGLPPVVLPAEMLVGVVTAEPEPADP